jgi:hypothetical protein
MSKSFSKKSTKISMSLFPRLFLFKCVFGWFSAMGVQKHYKKRFAKQIVSKKLYKKFDQKSKNDFCRFYFYHLSRFCVCFGEGSSKTRWFFSEFLFWPHPFFVLWPTHPPTTGARGSPGFFGRPLGTAPKKKRSPEGPAKKSRQTPRTFDIW